MGDSGITVDFHCHSTLSDGTLSPEELAEHFAARGVTHASLTDHDSVDGCARFRLAAGRHGVGCIDGVEITTASTHGELHILGYGIDPGHPGLVSALAGVRRLHDPGMQGLVDSLKRIGAHGDPPRAAALSSAEAIRLVHAAGGVACLAHPFTPARSSESLTALLAELKKDGLDGIEALYSPYPGDAQANLLRAAEEHDLAVSAGSDFHGPSIPGQSTAGVTMSTALWNAFRDRLLGQRGPARANVRGPATAATRLGGFAARVALPTGLALALFVVSTFAVIIPRFEAMLLERKKEMIRELTASAVSVIAEYEADERAGRLTRQEAQAGAAARIRDIRYGREGKDYFWITDMHPVMIMHPYRPDLDGQDVSTYADAQGVRVFVEFVNAVRQKSEGYVEYLWQWKDDASRIVPKLSFVRQFAPWNWVVGTGIYLEDVRAEIAALARRLVWLFTGIAVLLGLLLAFVVQQSLSIERRRRAAEAGLHDSHEKYRALVEAATEGMLMVASARCVYANKVFLDMAGYSESELPLLAPSDLFLPAEGDTEGLALMLGAFARGQSEQLPGLECRLAARAGVPRDVVITASPFELPGRKGWILVVRDLGTWRRAQADPGRDPYAAIARVANVGLFRAAWGRRGALQDANPAARSIFGIPADAGDDALAHTGLFALPADPAEGERLYEELAADGALRCRELRIACGDGESRQVALSLALARESAGVPRLVEGMVEDLGPRRREERRRDDLIAELQASSLYLSDEAGKLARVPCACSLETSVGRAAVLMTRAGADAILVTSAAGDAAGIVTDRDLRERAVAGRVGPDAPVREIMTAPLVWMSEHALLSEAVAAMRERDIGHLLLKNAAGAVTGMLRARDLVHLQRHSAAHVHAALGAARTPEEVAEQHAGLAPLARQLLESGARPRVVGRILSNISDLVVRRLVELAAGESGAVEPGPAADGFAFLALGSEGRQEQVPGSDQDNALVFTDPQAQQHFLSIGQKVCGWLDGMGVPFCKGGIMAKNPAWCVPVAGWEAYFVRWIREPEPQELLDLNIFFDFRCVAGAQALADGLRQFVSSLLAETPSFFVHLARDLLRKKLPAHLPKSGTAVLDVKDTMAPLVAFARLYALRHGVTATNTYARIEALREANVLKPSTAEDLLEAWTFLVELRMRTGAHPFIGLRDLARGEEPRLRHALAQLPLVHRTIGYDFPGSAL